MDYDINKIDDMVLALLCMTLHEDYGATRALKGHDWIAQARPVVDQQPRIGPTARVHRSAAVAVVLPDPAGSRYKRKRN